MEMISAQFCPACKFKNDLTATVCVYCGASLENIRKGENTTRRVNEETKIISVQQEGGIGKGPISPSGIAIYAEDGLLAGIREEKEFFLGRKVEETEDVLFDLIPFGAFQQGVSRRHAIIRQAKHGYYEVVDLNSTNGTYIDGKRLVSNRPYLLPSASRLSLGRMRLFVLYAKLKTENKTPE